MSIAPLSPAACSVQADFSLEVRKSAGVLDNSQYAGATKMLQHPARRRIFIVGIKGTGTSGLADILVQRGAVVSGSDSHEVFYTDEILHRIGVPVVGFDKPLPENINLVIYSAAYNPLVQPQLVRAEMLGIPCLSYFEALGILAAKSKVCAVCGTHGKTSTTAILGTIAKEMHLSATTLVGSGVTSFDGHSTYMGGEDFFIVESCEYKRHFLHFYPWLVIFTSLEGDHFDSYTGGINDLKQSFLDFLRQIEQGGHCVYCADDPAVVEVITALRATRPDIHCVPYGFTAEGAFGLRSQLLPGKTLITLQGTPEPWEIRFPGAHTALNATAAIGAIAAMVGCDVESEYSLLKGTTSEASQPEETSYPTGFMMAMQQGLSAFRGIKRRSEVVGECHGVLVLDDYGHHPTEIITTLQGLREFYPNRRLVVSFMSHTYSRTAALFDEFVRALQEPDLLFLHSIYGSAREAASQITVTGKSLYQATIKNGRTEQTTWYYHNHKDATEVVVRQLRRGDIFITMGAGDNWLLGKAVLAELKAGESP